MNSINIFNTLSYILFCVCVVCAVGGLFGQQAQAQPNQLINTASALSAPTLLNDERDAILAKWNQLQAFWGTGKGYFNHNIPPVDFTQENPFCRFKVRHDSGGKDKKGQSHARKLAK